MHIHGNSMNINAADFYSFGNGNRAAGAERAAAVRKRLLKASAGVLSAETSEETLMIGKWQDSRQSQVGNNSEYHAGASGKDSDLG